MPDNDTVWLDMKSNDPRLAMLEYEAVVAVYDGTTPDDVYAEVKPFLARLAGPARGTGVVLQKPTRLQREFAQCASGEVLCANEDALRSQHAFDVAMDCMDHALKTAARRRAA